MTFSQNTRPIKCLLCGVVYWKSVGHTCAARIEPSPVLLTVRGWLHLGEVAIPGDGGPSSHSSPSSPTTICDITCPDCLPGVDLDERYGHA